MGADQTDTVVVTGIDGGTPSVKEATVPKGQITSSTPSVLKHYEEYKLKNGLRLLWIRDDALPSVSIGALLTVGSAQDPTGAFGATDLMANQMTRETAQLDSVKLAEQLGMMGADVGVEVDADFLYFQASGLSQYATDLAKLFSDILLRPPFRKNETARIKQQALSALRSRADDPGDVASELFNRSLFGLNPYGRLTLGNEKDVRGMSSKELADQYRALFSPDRLVLVIAGRSDASFVQKVRDQFEGFTNAGKAELNPMKAPEIKTTTTTYVKKAGLVQAQIRMGHLGIERRDPDFLPLKIAMSILGGGFSSRLVDHVRDNLGLTYSISSSMDGKAYPGAFEISTFTQLANVARTVTESLTVLKEFVAKGVTENEVSSAQQYLIGRFPQAIETAERLGMNLALLRRYGLSDDYLIHYAGHLNHVSASEVNAAIKKHLTPEKLRILVLADKDDVLNQLRLIGPVEVKDAKLE